jgi:hypothetical protein
LTVIVAYKAIIQELLGSIPTVAFNIKIKIDSKFVIIKEERREDGSITNSRNVTVWPMQLTLLSATSIKCVKNLYGTTRVPTRVAGT